MGKSRLNWLAGYFASTVSLYHLKNAAPKTNMFLLQYLGFAGDWAEKISENKKN